MLADVWLTLVGAYDPAAGQLRVDEAPRVVAAIYACKFGKHVGGAREYPAILAALRSSKLSQAVRDRMPSVERIAVTLRNVNWVLQVRPPNTCARNTLG